jgi:oxygen-independent coproporphyrinogen-3 oxidase
MVLTLGQAGVNRASLGVQSFDPQVQRAINRVQSFEQTARAAERLRAVGIHGINLDLIYGLPHQTVESCLETVRQCLALKPERFSVFGYAHVPGFKKHQRKIDEDALPGSVGRHAQASAIAEALTCAGYRRIGLDHFALPTDGMAAAQAQGTLHRNFQGYTTDPCETLIGFGASAIGRPPQGYVQNDPVLRSYCGRIGRGEFAIVKGRTLTADDRLRSEIIERPMCDFEVDLSAVCLRHGAEPEPVLRSAGRLDELAAEGIVHVEGMRLRIAEDAHDLVRSVAAAFDSYLSAAGGRHSRAV